MKITRSQTIELNEFYGHSIFCMFCGKKVVDWEAQAQGRDDGIFNPCIHTLFIGQDEGFEYRSDRWDQAMGIVGVETDDLELPEHGIDGLTDNSAGISDAFKVATYPGPPGGVAGFVGFAPVDLEE